MCHESFNSNINNVSNTHDRFTSIKLSLHGQPTILAISAYLPTSGKDDEFLACLAELSNFIVEINDENGTILISTDSNCSEKSTTRRIHGFQQFCENHDLLKIYSSDPTFHHSNGLSSSNIDFFLLSRKTAPILNNLSLQCNQENPQNLSSHDPVIATFTLHIQE